MWIYYNLLPVFWLWLLWHSFPGVCLPPWLIPHIAEYSKLKGTWWAWSPRSFSHSSHCQPEMRMGLMLSGVYQCLQLPGSQLLPRTAKCHGSTWQEKANSFIHRLHQGLCGCTTMASSLEVKTEYKLGPQRKPWKDLRKIPTPSTSQPFQSSYLVNKGPTRPSWSILYRHGDSLLLSLLQGGFLPGSKCPQPSNTHCRDPLPCWVASLGWVRGLSSLLSPWQFPHPIGSCPDHTLVLNLRKQCVPLHWSVRLGWCHQPRSGQSDSFLAPA